MKLHVLTPGWLWRCCGLPGSAWFLVFLPFALLAADSSPSLPAAMARLLAVLLIAGLLWARGLGPVGTWPDRFFVAGWTGGWAAGLGWLAVAAEWRASTIASSGMALAILVGAGWLGWTYHLRQQLGRAEARESGSDSTESAMADASTVAIVWIAASLTFSMFFRASSAHWGDGLVVLVALLFFTVFQHGETRVSTHPSA